MKLSRARAIHRVQGLLAKHMGTSELNVNRLIATSFSKIWSKITTSYSNL